jgi:hypothetical protein
MLDIYDKVMSYEDNINIYNHVLNDRKFRYGETDTALTPPTGMIDELLPDEALFKTLHNIIVSKNPSVLDMKIKRAYINLFFPSENPYFHSDGNVLTCLFYITQGYDSDMGGETQFLIDDKITGVLNYPARLVMFDGKIRHRATSYRNQPRITIALKYSA